MYKQMQKGWLKHLDFTILDLLCLGLSYVLAFVLRHGMAVELMMQPAFRNLGFILLVTDLFMIVLTNPLHKVMSRGYLVELQATVRQDIVVLAGTTVVLFSVKDSESMSRIVLWLTFILHVVLSYLTRIGWKGVVRRYARRAETALLLVSSRDGVRAVLERFANNPYGEIRISGIVLTDSDESAVEGIPVVCALAEAPLYICREWIDEVYICQLPPSPLLARLIERCREMGVTIHRELPDNGDEKCVVESMAGQLVMTSSMNIATPGQMFLKRSMDILGGIVGSVIALVIIAVVGPIIKKASPGPVLFRQERIGRNGKRFTMLKIRSMRLDAEAQKASLMSENRVEDGRMFKLDFDPRIIGNRVLPDGSHRTGIGEFIRRTSLDEFPQFFCVLMGTMSMVGTRPPTVDEWEKYQYHHRARMSIKPGMTGLWQVSGRSAITDFEEVVKLDTEYINNWSLNLDIKILFRTILTLFHQEGAM